MFVRDGEGWTHGGVTENSGRADGYDREVGYWIVPVYRVGRSNFRSHATGT